MKVKIDSQKDNQKLQGGVASIFVVIFFTLLLGIVTISFVQITNQDQRQALNNDLSQSAYDSAQAGVEDAKRALDTCRSNSDCNPDESFTKDCKDDQLTNRTETEVNVAQSDEDNKFNQAYTCVNVTYKTKDYKNSLNAETTDFIPLKGTGDFGTIRLSWTKADDAGVSPQTAASTNVSYMPNAANEAKLPQSSGQWGAKNPALMRIQLIELPKVNPTLEAINNASRTAFLYPQSSGPQVISAYGSDPSSLQGRAGTDGVASKIDLPRKVKCNPQFNEEYVCKDIKITGLNTASNDYYLLVSPLYANITQFKLELIGDGDSIVSFDGVQPKIDATGRADDVFRRVETRVRFDDNSKIMDYPAFDSADSLCKALSVGSIPEHYENLCTE